MGPGGKDAREVCKWPASSASLDCPLGSASPGLCVTQTAGEEQLPGTPGCVGSVILPVSSSGSFSIFRHKPKSVSLLGYKVLVISLPGHPVFIPLITVVMSYSLGFF